jgi:hypothetical protein
MRMLTPWTAAWITAALVLTASVIAASAQIQTRGAAGLHAQLQNATPIQRAACWDGAPIVRRERSAAAARIAAGAFLADGVPLLFQSFEVIDQARPPLGSFRSRAAAWFAVRCNPNGLRARG